MAAFSSFQHLDASSSSSSVLSLPNPNSSSSSPLSLSPSPSTTINKMCALFHDPNNALSQFYQHNLHHHSTTNKNHYHIEPPLLNNIISTNKKTMEYSSISVVSQKKITLPLNKKRKSKPASCPNSAQSKDMREVKGGKKQKKVKEKKEGEEVQTDYIHVRARRGQATDSHSLAERVRRERISERMKLLQSLVPGCDKVTGKALMLDEIINYVQSLQNQVEFLSMKLASVNPIFYDFGMDLESFMVGPDQNLNSLMAASNSNSMQECCSPTTTTTPIANTYPVLDNSLLLHQSQIPNAHPLPLPLPLPQGDRQFLWEVDDQRQRIINQTGINNNLFSFLFI